MNPTNKNTLDIAEHEIDESFPVTALKELGYTQAVWTLLSSVEEGHFFMVNDQSLGQRELEAYIDETINSITYPLRICLKTFVDKGHKLNKGLVDEQYKAANEWIKRAYQYRGFCSLITLVRFRKLELQFLRHKKLSVDWNKNDLSYEAYDRKVKSNDLDKSISFNPNDIAIYISESLTIHTDSFDLKFNPALVKRLRESLRNWLYSRFSLPNHWEFKKFSIVEFRDVFTTIQSMSYGWFIARNLAAQTGIYAVGYSSALWTPKKDQLLPMLSRYTGVNSCKIEIILEYLTFGNVGIRHPDIAIQPLIDLKNGALAIPSLVWQHSNCERNLCVLLNQIEEERTIYLSLVEQKEVELRRRIKEKLDGSGYDIKHGMIDATDIDLAIIDRVNNKCISIELKWFIEPAEIREVVQRSEEIERGIKQAKKIQRSWENKEPLLVNNVLGIGANYDFMSVVASVTSIGDATVQDDNIPVIKIWHLIDTIIKNKNLGLTMEWLRKRDYLPKQGIDFDAVDTDIECGDWSAKWYGIKLH